ncbi:MAG TPA: hypothetical protein VFN02_14870, partial [Ktedonobacteraceae bacterium]|nr:hypothetical protein [Ktedonobacteraceae bacterium]
RSCPAVSWAMLDATVARASQLLLGMPSFHNSPSGFRVTARGCQNGCQNETSHIPEREWLA